MHGKVCALVVIMMVLVTNGCTSNKLPYHHESQQIDNLNELWTVNTIDRIHSSRGVDGGYSDFPPEKPTLYSTYYFLESLKLLDEDPKHKKATIGWLLSKEQEIFKQTNDTTMRDIYFLTMSLEFLDAKPINRSRLISKVMELQMPDGSFADRNGDKGTLLDTFRAVNILSSLGADMSDLPLTKEWLIGKSMKSEENNNLINSLSDMYMSISALELYGINISTSQEYGNRVDLIDGQKKDLEKQLGSLSENQVDLFALNLFTGLLVITDDITPKIRSDVGIYLNEKQLDDGGFNALLGEYGESHGTYLAIKIASNIGLKLNNNVCEFIYSHELSSGGFRPAYRLISSLGNTYTAVSSLKILGLEPFDKEKLIIYLENKWKKDPKRADHVYYLLMTYALINKTPPSEIQIKTWIKTEFEDCSTKPIEAIDLRELYYLTKVANILDVEFNDEETIVSKLQGIQNNDGGFGFENSDTYTTFLVVSILSGFDAHPLDKKGCISWIRGGQTNDGGFRFRSGYFSSSNNSDLYSTYLSVVSLENTSAEPEDTEGLLKWLSDCQDETGGFRLAPKYSNLDASPESLEEKLEYTGWGLIIWDIYDLDCCNYNQKNVTQGSNVPQEQVEPQKTPEGII